MPPADPFRRLILASLALKPVPGVPEISIHTAHERSRLGRFAVDSPYFAYPWAGGIALARYVLDNPGIVAGRRVLDLGAGSGLVGIAAALAGAATVTAAETDAAAVCAVALNAAANGVRIDICDGDVLDGPPPAADVVLAGDVFYAPGVAARVAAFLARCVAANIAVLVGDPGRADLPRERLSRLATCAVADFGSGTRPVEAAIYAFAPGADATATLAPDAQLAQEEPSSPSGPLP